MEPQSSESNTAPGPHGSLTVEILACITAAAIITASAYPIAREVARWLGP
jgi:hypothetical protein